MAENERLRDLLLIELTNIHLFGKLLKYPMVHENLLKIFKVRNRAPQMMMLLPYYLVFRSALALLMVCRGCWMPASLVRRQKRNRMRVPTTTTIPAS